MKKSLFYLEGVVALAYDAFAQMFSSPPLPQELVRLPTYDYRNDSITKSSTHASLMEITSAEDRMALVVWKSLSRYFTASSSDLEGNLSKYINHLFMRMRCLREGQFPFSHIGRTAEYRNDE